MRNKIREHGEIWEMNSGYLSPNPNRFIIETIKPVHHGKYPYGIWVEIGKDIEVLELTQVEGSV